MIHRRLSEIFKMFVTIEKSVHHKLLNTLYAEHLKIIRGPATPLWAMSADLSSRGKNPPPKIYFWWGDESPYWERR